MKTYGVFKLKKKSNLESILLELFDPGLENNIQTVLSIEDETILNDLKDQIEQDINDSIDSENQSFIDESIGANGLAYETTVLRAIKRAKMQGNIKQGAGYDNISADADISIDGKIFNVEVKLDKNAQMGGSSVRFDSKGVNLVKPMEKGTNDVLIAAVSAKAEELNNLVGYLTKQRPTSVNQKVQGFPLACTEDAWTRAVNKGLLVNTVVKYTTDFIAKHYAKKGIYYIQLGGAGLFYMAGNPANLPVPKLKGDINIEIRSARSGAKALPSGLKVIGGGIRVQARLKTKGISPYTADSSASLGAMMDEMKKRKKDPN